MLPIRQGDVILKAVNHQITGCKLPHLTLAEGEVNSIQSIATATTSIQLIILY